MPVEVHRQEHRVLQAIWLRDRREIVHVHGGGPGVRPSGAVIIQKATYSWLPAVHKPPDKPRAA